MSKVLPLGSRAKDIVTGFTGILTARIQYLTGCDRYNITPVVKKGESKIEESNSFDVNSIEILDEWVSLHFAEQPSKAPKLSKTGWPASYKVSNQRR